jgi:glycosyltransferase involved in cell wall biosynthesis
MSTLDLTIAIPAKNEESNLADCLKAIGKDFAKQIVIIDSGSTDNTKAIAAKFGVQVIDFKWDGKFPKKRNWYLRNHKPATKWILFLDADEYLTSDFKNEVKKKLNIGYSGYWLSYTIHFLGKRLKGGYPLKKLALFQVGAGEYEKIDEDRWSEMDMEIHEHPILDQNIGTIKSKIDHQDFRGIEHYVKKHNEYSSWEAGRYLQSFSNPQVRSGWTWKQKVKYALMESTLIGPAYFFGSFIVLGGFRDGARGFAFAILKMSYFTQIHCKIKELKEYKIPPGSRLS